MILTAAVIVMILVAMSYANNILNLKLAQNEFSSNRQFMQTASEQIDDIAWTIGRTQTVTFSNRFGSLTFKDAIVNYTVSIHTSLGWENITLKGETGIVSINMPTSAYTMSDNYFERVPYSVNNSFLLSSSSAPVGQVICTQKSGMTDGSYLRVVLVPTIRMLTSSIAGGQTYLKFYLPSMQTGESPYRNPSLTLTGEGISKITRSGVDQIILATTFPKAAEGFDANFFNFKNTVVTLNNSSSPRLPSNSVVEFYVGNVGVSIGTS
jgi:hypothetical protein